MYKSWQVCSWSHQKRWSKRKGLLEKIKMHPEAVKTNTREPHDIAWVAFVFNEVWLPAVTVTVSDSETASWSHDILRTYHHFRGAELTPFHCGAVDNFCAFSQHIYTLSGYCLLRHKTPVSQDSHGLIRTWKPSYNTVTTPLFTCSQSCGFITKRKRNSFDHNQKWRSCYYTCCSCSILLMLTKVRNQSGSK